MKEHENKRIGILNYGTGNIFSLSGAIARLGAVVKIISQPEELRYVDALILPGVGAFKSAMRSLHQQNLVGPIRDFSLVKKKPLLGICLGMQLLSTKSNEFGEYNGLNLISGKVKQLEVNKEKLPLPHIGWNDVESKVDSDLFNGIATETFYFVHSFHFVPDSISSTIGTCHYGDDFVAAVKDKNIYGTQFHPEKSQYNGLVILNNFLFTIN